MRKETAHWGALHRILIRLLVQKEEMSGTHRQTARYRQETGIKIVI
jgi:hypothetical protein